MALANDLSVWKGEMQTAVDALAGVESSLQESLEENAELRQSRKKLATESEKRRRAQAKERAAFLAKVEALKRSVAKEHAQAKAAVAQGETNKKKAEQSAAALAYEFLRLNIEGL